MARLYPDGDIRISILRLYILPYGKEKKQEIWLLGIGTSEGWIEEERMPETRYIMNWLEETARKYFSRQKCDKIFKN